MAHILLVEMHSDIRSTVQATLEGAGFRLSSRENAADALALLNRERPDIAIIDLDLASTDGVRFASRIAERGVPVLIIAKDEAHQHLLERTRCLWLPVPIPARRLLTIIRDLLGISPAQRALIAVRLQRLAAVYAGFGRSAEHARQSGSHSQSGSQEPPRREAAAGAGAASQDSLFITSHRLGPAQCRAARALLRWSQSDLTRRAAVARKTVVDFETKRRALHRRTREALQRAFQDAGIKFLWGEGRTNSKGDGVFLAAKPAADNDPEDEDEGALCMADN